MISMNNPLLCLSVPPCCNLAPRLSAILFIIISDHPNQCHDLRLPLLTVTGMTAHKHCIDCNLHQSWVNCTSHRLVSSVSKLHIAWNWVQNNRSFVRLNTLPSNGTEFGDPFALNRSHETQRDCARTHETTRNSNTWETHGDQKRCRWEHGWRSEGAILHGKSSTRIQIHSARWWCDYHLGGRGSTEML